MTNNYQDSIQVARDADIGTPVIIGNNSHGVVIARDGDNVTVSWTVTATTTTVPAKTWAEMGMTVDEEMIAVSESAARAYLAQGGTEEGAVEFGARQAIAYYRALQSRPIKPSDMPKRVRTIGRV